jgi:anti-sigma regulatory factor (Ser/Thr protein kinase)
VTPAATACRLTRPLTWALTPCLAATLVEPLQALAADAETVVGGGALFWSFLALNLAIITAAAVRRSFRCARPRKEVATTQGSQCIAFTVDNDLQGLQAASERLREFGEDLDLPVRTVFDLCFMVEEMLSSVLSGGFAEGERVRLRIQAAREKKSVRLIVEWDGKPFDPLAVAEIDPTAPLEDISLDGWEVHLLRRFTDELGYARQGRVNRLYALRHIPAVQPA